MHIPYYLNITILLPRIIVIIRNARQHRVPKKVTSPIFCYLDLAADCTDVRDGKILHDLILWDLILYSPPHPYPNSHYI